MGGIGAAEVKRVMIGRAAREGHEALAAANSAASPLFVDLTPTGLGESGEELSRPVGGGQKTWPHIQAKK